jgi:hypothetical protein
MFTCEHILFLFEYQKSLTRKEKRKNSIYLSKFISITASNRNVYLVYPTNRKFIFSFIEYKYWEELLIVDWIYVELSFSSFMLITSIKCRRKSLHIKKKHDFLHLFWITYYYLDRFFFFQASVSTISSYIVEGHRPENMWKSETSWIVLHLFISPLLLYVQSIDEVI